MNGDQSFLGTGWGFPPEFNMHSGTVRMVSAERDIEESLVILLGTIQRERVMQPEYGCSLKAKVFENINESTLTLIRDEIRQAVLFFEPRIDLENIDFNTSEQLEGILHIQLSYVVRTTNSRSNLVYPFYFLEGNNVAA